MMAQMYKEEEEGKRKKKLAQELIGNLVGEKERPEISEKVSRKRSQWQTSSSATYCRLDGRERKIAKMRRE